MGNVLAVIPDAEIKKNCYSCCFSEFVDKKCEILRCNLTGCEVDQYAKQRNKACPLVVIKQHGRLIDADELLKQAATYLGSMSNEFFRTSIEIIINEIVANTPTVIAAEVKQ